MASFLSLGYRHTLKAHRYSTNREEVWAVNAGHDENECSESWTQGPDRCYHVGANHQLLGFLLYTDQKVVLVFCGYELPNNRNKGFKAPSGTLQYIHPISHICPYPLSQSLCFCYRRQNVSFSGRGWPRLSDVSARSFLSVHFCAKCILFTTRPLSTLFLPHTQADSHPILLSFYILPSTCWPVFTLRRSPF